MTLFFRQARNIFDFKNGDYSEAEYGIQVPQGVVLHVARQTSTFMEDFADEEEYVRRRLSDLQVSLDLVDTDIFRMKNRGGFTRRVHQLVHICSCSTFDFSGHPTSSSAHSVELSFSEHTKTK